MDIDGAISADDAPPSSNAVPVVPLLFFSWLKYPLPRLASFFAACILLEDTQASGVCCCSSFFVDATDLVGSSNRLFGLAESPEPLPSPGESSVTSSDNLKCRGGQACPLFPLKSTGRNEDRMYNLVHDLS